jgi:hypothetical protein
MREREGLGKPACITPLTDSLRFAYRLDKASLVSGVEKLHSHGVDMLHGDEWITTTNHQFLAVETVNLLLYRAKCTARKFTRLPSE